MNAIEVTNISDTMTNRCVVLKIQFVCLVIVVEGELSSELEIELVLESI